jgi:hypothetical protein
MHASELPNTYTIRNYGGQLSISHDFEVELSPNARQRIQAQLDMIKEVAGDIGDFAAVWSLQDAGRVFTSFDQMRGLDVAREGGSCEFSAGLGSHCGSVWADGEFPCTANLLDYPA